MAIANSEPTQSSSKCVSSFKDSYISATFLRNPEIVPCNCDGSSYDDKHDKHIVMGDLHVIKKNVLKISFTKGPKFRENKAINFDKAKSCILIGPEECVQKWYDKNGVNKNILAEPTNNITDKINDRINVLNASLR